MDDDVTEWLVQWFARNADLPREEVQKGADRNYFNEGWTDSVRFINLVADAEEKFAIRFRQEDFQDRDFATLAGLAAIIRERQHG